MLLLLWCHEKAKTRTHTTKKYECCCEQLLGTLSSAAYYVYVMSVVAVCVGGLSQEAREAPPLRGRREREQGNLAPARFEYGILLLYMGKESRIQEVVTLLLLHRGQSRVHKLHSFARSDKHSTSTAQAQRKHTAFTLRAGLSWIVWALTTMFGCSGFFGGHRDTDYAVSQSDGTG